MSEPSTTLRYMAMLGHIPCKPRKCGVSELHEKLVADGFDIDKRSVQRDLNTLSSRFPLVRDRGRAAGWSWQEGCTRISMPPMDPAAALTWELVSRYLKPVLPNQMSRHLQAEFAQARATLNQHATAPLGKWSARIAVLPQGHQLLPPRISAGVSEVVYQALLNERRFETDYLGLGATDKKRQVLNPQALVYRQGVLYLVATAWDYNDIRQYALHRMSSAKLSHEPATPLKGFDLRRYIEEEKGFDLPAGKSITLELKVAPWLAQHLDECKLAESQVIKPVRGGKYATVTAKLEETEQLYWWLCSLGPNVEILKPLALRKRIAKDLQAAAGMYA